MPRYIDADSALAFPLANGKYDRKNANKHFIYGCETYKEYLEQLPTISPDEARGAGKWETKHNKVAWWYECSCCHERPLISRFGDMENLSAYCPYCGANMEVTSDA